MDQKSNIISKDRQLPGQVLSPLSGKDDAGKTNVATDIAITLTNCNRTSISVDADSALANIDFWLLESTSSGRVGFFSKRLAGADARSVS